MAKGHDGSPADTIEGTLTREDISRISSLEDLLVFFKVDTERWEVRDFRINKWESASGSEAKGGITVTPLYQVRANLIPRVNHAELAQLVWEEIIEDINELAFSMGVAQPVERAPYDRTRGDERGEPVLFEIAVFDPHIGMLAWGKEVGESYDVDIAVRDYTHAVRKGLHAASMYNVERVLYVAGNDFLHVDGPAMGMRGGATAAGTPQDFDGRLARMFTAGRRALTRGIDAARQIAPVDVLFVPGNHDTRTTYHMAEVVAAWFRNDPDVTVIYGPQKRKYYGYGSNTFMFTHGEEYARTTRDSLPLIFATECPPELWVAGEHREIHTGHNHIRKGGRYIPTYDVQETRALITRSLPGLTPEDSWHYEQGYKHKRAATTLAFNRSGGLAGLHEITL